MINQKGFTLLELIVSMAIVAALAAITMPSYHHYIAKAKLTNLINESSQLETELVDYIYKYNTYGAHYKYNGRYPASSVSSINYIQPVKAMIDADSHFHFINMWSGQCNRPGLTVHVAANADRHTPLISGGAPQYHIRFDNGGHFLGISPSGGSATNRPWWPHSKMYAYQEMQAIAERANGEYEHLCATP